jgi:hypothetical protein
VFDIVHSGREGAFEDRRKPVFHLLRIEAGILPGDGDHRDIDSGKDVRRRPLNNDGTEDENEQSEDNKGIGTAERHFDDPYLAFSFPSSRALARHTRASHSSQGDGRRAPAHAEASLPPGRGRCLASAHLRA